MHQNQALQSIFFSLLASAQPRPATDIDLPALLTLAAAMGSGPKKPISPEKRERMRLRGTTLASYARDHFFPERNHNPTGATALLTCNALARLAECYGREITLRESTAGMMNDFRNWMARQISAGTTYGPVTANKHLRHLRSLLNHAARNRLIRRVPPINFIAEPDHDVEAWNPHELELIEEQARQQVGMVGDVPAALFWTAWALVAEKIGCRITAQMLTRRRDYDPVGRILLLRRSTQKQKKDQRVALTPRAAEAVEKLLAAHAHEEIFGSWPYDPPLKSGTHKWKVLAKHFEDQLVTPAGLKLNKGVKTRQFRRSAATIVHEAGGNAQELLGHASPKTTELYLSKDPKRRKVCRQSLLIPDASPQKLLFD